MKRLPLILALCLLPSLALAQQTRATLNQNTTPSPALNANIISSTGFLADTNTWTGTNSFPGGTTSSSPIPQQAYNAITTAVSAGNIPLPAASLTGGSVAVFLDETSTTSGSAGLTITLPTVAATVTAMKSAGLLPVAGMTWELDIYNDQVTGTNTMTLTADAGPTWTLSGTAQTIANAKVRKYLVTLTSLTAGTMQSLGLFTPTAVP